jgi:cyclase
VSAAPAGYTVEVADGVFAYVQPDGGWCVSNAGILIGREALTLIDTAATERRARALRATAGRLSGAPVRTIVNTHHHGDHTFGNAMFSPGATVVGHERTRQEMAARGLSLRSVWPQVEWGAVDVVLPSVTFTDRLTLHVDDYPVELLHVGPAHTTNDVVAWLPTQRVLFAGDVLMSGCTPFILMGSLQGALNALQRLRALDPRTVVCGHGTVCGPEVITRTESYLRWIGELARAGRDAGRTPLEVARDTGLGAFADLLDPERLVANLHRAYAELDGAEPGAYLASGPVFTQMSAYLNGRPVPSDA